MDKHLKDLESIISLALLINILIPTNTQLKQLDIFFQKVKTVYTVVTLTFEIAMQAIC